MKREKERVRGYTEWRGGGGVRDGYVRHLHSLNFNNFQQAGTAHTHRPISNQSLLCFFFFLGGKQCSTGASSQISTQLKISV